MFFNSFLSYILVFKLVIIAFYLYMLYRNRYNPYVPRSIGILFWFLIPFFGDVAFFFYLRSKKEFFEEIHSGLDDEPTTLSRIFSPKYPLVSYTAFTASSYWYYYHIWQNRGVWYYTELSNSISNLPHIEDPTHSLFMQVVYMCVVTTMLGWFVGSFYLRSRFVTISGLPPEEKEKKGYTKERIKQLIRENPMY